MIKEQLEEVQQAASLLGEAARLLAQALCNEPKPFVLDGPGLYRDDEQGEWEVAGMVRGKWWLGVRVHSDELRMWTTEGRYCPFGNVHRRDLVRKLAPLPEGNEQA